MSELKNIHDSRSTIRWKLLASVSTFALTVAVSSMSVVKADEIDHPLIWIELGGQMDNISGQGEAFAPAVLAANPTSPVFGPTTPLQAQRPPKFSFGEESTLSFQPENSDWIFSAGLRIGRSSNIRHVHHQTSRAPVEYVTEAGYQYRTTAADFADTNVHHRESHEVLDFMAGKDVGLGLFGRESESVLNFGVRVAQFSSKETFDLRARPDLYAKYFTYNAVRIPLIHFHTYHASGQASRNFHGVGPSIAWNSSSPFVGDPQDGEIALDWGVNASVLFGRQRTQALHHESAHYKSLGFNNFSYSSVYNHPSRGHETNRSVTVPNVGGFAGLTYRVEDFKVSAGYRADFFFGAIDGGIDARKSETLGFYGPFASVSVGIGG